jgi:hypothetical protein
VFTTPHLAFTAFPSSVSLSSPQPQRKRKKKARWNDNQGIWRQGGLGGSHVGHKKVEPSLAELETGLVLVRSTAFRGSPLRGSSGGLVQINFGGRERQF